VFVDNSARWFLAGIVISLINTGLVLAFIGIPGITDLNDSDSTVEIVEVAGPAITYVIVQDEDGNVLVERTRLSADGVSTEAMTAAEALSGDALTFEDPVFADIARPTFIAAGDDVAYVVSQGQFGLWKIDLEGESSEVDLDGIDDLGSTMKDVAIATDGTLYLLVADGVFDWRLFHRSDDDDWTQLTSSILSGWPAQVVAMTVTDNRAIYLTASQPLGVYRLVAPFREVDDWVPGAGAQGVDVAPDDSLLLYAAPETAPRNAVNQVRFVHEGRFGVWQSMYPSCGDTVAVVAAVTPVPTPEPEPEATATVTAEADASADTTSDGDATATPEAVEVEAKPAGPRAPQFPRDVAVVDAERALIVDTLSHAVRLQIRDGGGRVLFGVACEAGSDDLHLQNPRGVTIDGAGNVFISDTANNRVVVLPAR
jgi:subtilisin family serine protease